jgi:hypothetical protein
VMPTFLSMDDVSFLRPVHIGTTRDTTNDTTRRHTTRSLLVDHETVSAQRLGACAGEPGGLHLDQHARL